MIFSAQEDFGFSSHISLCVAWLVCLSPPSFSFSFLSLFFLCLHRSYLLRPFFLLPSFSLVLSHAPLQEFRAQLAAKEAELADKVATYEALVDDVELEAAEQLDAVSGQVLYTRTELP